MTLMGSAKKVLSSIQKKIIVRAVKIRLNKGENIDDILASYPKLSEKDKADIKKELGIE